MSPIASGREARDPAPGDPAGRRADAAAQEAAREALERRCEWGYASSVEHRWPASVAILVAIALQIIIPDRLSVGLGPRWLIPTLEGVLALALLIASPHRTVSEAVHLRVAAIVLIALVNIANAVSLVELIHALLLPIGAHTDGRQLVEASIPIWGTNVIVFGLWYWELDRGGPSLRQHAGHQPPDFLFPQMTAPGSTHGVWTPKFFDYVYTSFTNATAFSPTDTMPLTSWAKLLMMAQSMASLLTVAIVVSRAVNILS